MKKTKKKIGIIGAGNRGILNLGAKLIRHSDELNLQVSAICDNNVRRLQEATTHLSDIAQESGQAADFLTFSTCQELIDSPEVDWVIITTPQFLHRESFEYALQKGKLLYCDKPLAHTVEDAEFMLNSWRNSGCPGVILGFTRRYENAWMRAKQLCDQGLIGDIKMIQLKSVIPYNTYFHRWHSSEKLSGGVLNEKSSHHFDAINWFADSLPLMISAMGGRSTYVAKNDMPEFCHECELDCAYRIKTQNHSQDQMQESFTSSVNAKEFAFTQDKCVFSPDTDIMDHAIVNIAYKNQVKAQLFLSVAGFMTDNQETLEIIGDKGKLSLERHSGRIVVYYNYGCESMRIDARDANHAESHFGADHFLLKQLGLFANQEIKPPVSVNEGYLATLMARLAIKSCRTNQTMNINIA